MMRMHKTHGPCRLRAKRRERPIEGPLPERVQIVRANLVYVEKKDLPPAMLNRLLRLAAFQNPEFYKAQAMRLSTYDKPRVIACGQEFAQHIAVPRGCLTETLALLEAHKIRPEVRDERYAGTAIEAEFQGQLRPFQEEAVAKIIGHDEGILCAPTAFGKTAVAAWLIAKRKVNTLVVVHRQQLLDQWQERLGDVSWICRRNRSGISAAEKWTGRVAWMSPSFRACTGKTR